MGNLLKIGEAAKRLGIDQQTVRSWTKKGKLNVIITPGGHRLYDEDELNVFFGKQPTQTKTEDPVVFLYARVSTKKQADSGNLDRQIGRLTEFAIQKGYKIGGMYKEVASGVNENRKELNKLLDQLKETPNSKVIIEYKDRLARFGYNYLEKYIQGAGSEIVVVEQKETNEEQELVEDLIAITTSFSARLYGKRGGKKVSNQIEQLLTKGE